MTSIQVREVDEVGRPVATYLATTKNEVNRVDFVRSARPVPVLQRLLRLFLPSGYPHTVSPDYTKYQIHDSLQAFSSSIAGLLASRAVLQGIGVGDQNASATSAMLLNVVQESMGRIATILFAHLVGMGVEAECKMYRFAADVFNDTAMFFDCASPLLPKATRLPLLCASSVFRAMCGVAGGASKATLSAHFASADNIGELNAKDSSQETVISLLGMLAGSFVVSHVSSNIATWIWLVALVVIHLSTNYAAVRAVTMQTLNRQRCNIVFSSLIELDVLLQPRQVARQEVIFERNGVLRSHDFSTLGVCHIGVPLHRLLASMGGRPHVISGALNNLPVPVERLLQIFRNERYLLWMNKATREATIVLSKTATARTQLKAWSHALRVAQGLHEFDDQSESMLTTLERTLRKHNSVFDQYLDRLESAGWNVDTPALETRPGKRICPEL